jgi:hypothetical protein
MSKPDNVSDNPGILPYGSNVGAPAIRIEKIGGWKQKNVEKVNKRILKKYSELNEEMQKLINDYNTNQLIYSAKFNFEPLIGETYHLYSGKDGINFLSLITPSEWKQTHLGSFILDSENKWEKI